MKNYGDLTEWTNNDLARVIVQALMDLPEPPAKDHWKVLSYRRCTKAYLVPHCENAIEVLSQRKIAAQEIDELVRKHTAFTCLEATLNTHPNYRPSLDCRDPELVRIADAYDAMQIKRGDDRRAYRYGV